MEWVVLWAVLSTTFNVYQSNENGQLEAEVKQLRNIAALCTKNGQRERRSVVLEANNRALTTQQNANSIAEYQQGLRMAFQANSGTCANTSVGNLTNGLVDAERRLLEELRTNRVQSEPTIVLPTFRSGAPED